MSLNGTVCVAETPGTVTNLLWIEVIAFQAAVLIIALTTLFYFVKGLEIVRERNEDLILCRDEQMTDYTLEGRFRTAPTYHLFNQDMTEYGNTSFYDDVTFEVSVGNKMLAQRRLDYMQRLF